MGMGDIANSGMQAAMQSMDVISNNIANANTPAFKRSTISFSDLYPSGNASSVQIGLGVAVTGVQQDFTPGGPVETNQLSDMSINGSGFFVMKDQTSGALSYSRYGSFNFNETTGYFMMGNSRLQGYAAANGVIPSGSSPTDLQINTDLIQAEPTANVTQQQLNLNPTDVPPTVTPFSTTNTATYNYTTVSDMYDSLGTINKLQLYYVKSATLNTWSVNAYVNGNSVGTGTMTFNTNGTLLSSSGLSSLSFSPTSGAASPQIIDVSMAGATQTGTQYNSTSFAVDGYGSGEFSGYLIDTNGNITAQYSNGQSVLAGQVALADFQSPQYLQNLGNNLYGATTNSGPATVNQTNSVSNISQGTLENSNVDLATEMVNLITAQNTFQANAQVEQTYVQVMQTVIKL